MSWNLVRLSAVLATVQPLRHTPGGVPIIDFILSHQSQQTEADNRRQVEFGITAKAAGELAVRIAEMLQGSEVEVQGFLNRKNRLGRQVTLHVTNIELI